MWRKIVSVWRIGRAKLNMKRMSVGGEKWGQDIKMARCDTELIYAEYGKAKFVKVQRTITVWKGSFGKKFRDLLDEARDAIRKGKICEKNRGMQTTNIVSVWRMEGGGKIKRSSVREKERYVGKARAQCVIRLKEKDMKRTSVWEGGWERTKDVG